MSDTIQFPSREELITETQITPTAVDFFYHVVSSLETGKHCLQVNYGKRYSRCTINTMLKLSEPVDGSFIDVYKLLSEGLRLDSPRNGLVTVQSWDYGTEESPNPQMRSFAFYSLSGGRAYSLDEDAAHTILVLQGMLILEDRLKPLPDYVPLPHGGTRFVS